MKHIYDTPKCVGFLSETVMIMILLFPLSCHLLGAFQDIHEAGVSEMVKYEACDIFFDESFSGQDSNFSLVTLDVL